QSGGSMSAGSEWGLKADTFETSGTIVAGSDASVSTRVLGLHHGVIQSGGTLTMDAGSATLQDGTVQAGTLVWRGNTLGLTDSSVLSMGNQAYYLTDGVTKTGGTLWADGDLSLQAHSWSHTAGMVGARGVTQVDVAGSFQNHGVMMGGGDVSIRHGAVTQRESVVPPTPTDLDNTGGILQSAGTLTVASTGGLINTDGTLMSQGDTRLQLGGSLYNDGAGWIHAMGNVAINADRVVNTGAGGGGIEGGEHVSMTATHLDNRTRTIGGRSLALTLQQGIDNQGGHLTAMCMQTEWARDYGLAQDPIKAAVCIMSIALPSAKPSLISNNTNSVANSFLAILSAQVAPTAPAPTTVIFIND
ncbi:hypothetical protein EBZ35_08620, partial [bacterium]|nr:hypothetical protein [bacterium]